MGKVIASGIGIVVGIAMVLGYQAIAYKDRQQEEGKLQSTLNLKEQELADLKQKFVKSEGKNSELTNRVSDLENQLTKIQEQLANINKEDGVSGTQPKKLGNVGSKIDTRKMAKTLVKIAKLKKNMKTKTCL